MPLRCMLKQTAKAAFGGALAIAWLASPVTAIGEMATIPVQYLPLDSRLAIWGDSITEVALYPRYVEMYLLACAGRKDIKVCTFGHSGETLGGLLSRQSDWIGTFNEDVVKGIVAVPQDVKVIALMSVGYPATGSVVSPSMAADRKVESELFGLDRF